MKRSRLLVGAVVTGLSATMMPAPAFACEAECQNGNAGSEVERQLRGLTSGVQLSSELIRLDDAIPKVPALGSSTGSGGPSAPAPSAPAVVPGAGSSSGSEYGSDAALGSAPGSGYGSDAALGSGPIGSGPLGSVGESAEAGVGSVAPGSSVLPFIPNMEVPVGVPFSYQIPLSSGSSAPLLSGLPAGLSYDSSTGLISGTALPGPARISEVGVIGSDGGSSQGSFTMSLAPGSMVDPGLTSSVLSSNAAGSSGAMGSDGALGSSGAMGSGEALGSSGAMSSESAGALSSGSGSASGSMSAGGSSTASSAAFGGLLSSVAAVALSAGVLGALSMGSSDYRPEDAAPAPGAPAGAENDNGPQGAGGGDQPVQTKGVPKNDGMGGGAPEHKTQPAAQAAPQQQLANTGPAEAINAFLLSALAFAAGGSLLLAQRRRG